MTVLGMFFSRFVNGVAQRHGEVARAMFPRYRIDAITNGVHVPTWVAPSTALALRPAPAPTGARTTRCSATRRASR